LQKKANCLRIVSYPYDLQSNAGATKEVMGTMPAVSLEAKSNLPGNPNIGS
jgi:hypothetical protein